TRPAALAHSPRLLVAACAGRIGISIRNEDPFVPGRHVTDQQVRIYMGFRRQHTQLIAAAKAGISERTGRRIERDPRLPSQKHAGRKRGRQVPDPLDGIWESDILPLLESRPGLRPIALLEEMQRRHPDRDWDRLRRTLE